MPLYLPSSCFWYPQITKFFLCGWMLAEKCFPDKRVSDDDDPRKAHHLSLKLPPFFTPQFNLWNTIE